MIFDNGMALKIDQSAEKRPISNGSKKPREFLPDDDLRRSVFLAPTSELWV
ncbi:hypothetical protein [Ruegeria atlantica]|uniref:hypothetical protein n=1 Tax=Ruegeria atlantica TaxID=81569 RepID=UPI001C2CA2CB|nr:hypothetical protein [Ruegeria atlantica]